VFLDDRGFPDQSNEYDHLLDSIHGGPVLRKLRHPMPDLNGPFDPSFDATTVLHSWTQHLLIHVAIDAPY
jgi:hypothetical protein